MRLRYDSASRIAAAPGRRAGSASSAAAITARPIKGCGAFVADLIERGRAILIVASRIPRH